MKKELRYNGYTANPSDYECNDGDLALAIGLIPEDGSLRPVLPPAEIMDVGIGNVIKYVHETSDYKHYILMSSDGTLSWIRNNNSAPTILHNFSVKVYQVTGIGNTLVILADDGMHYFLWKGGRYIYLGTHLPECPLSFGLQGEMKQSDEFEISFDGISEDKLYDEFTDSNKTRITSQVLAKVNKFIADNSTKKGKFLYPFLVRYAYRLYDGTLTMHSAPVLMVASSDLAPQVYYSEITGGDAYTNAKLVIVGVFHTLDYAVVSQSHLDNLLNWKDVVKSVDIFISKPIYTYDQSGECTCFKEIVDNDCYCICKHTNQAVSTTTYPLRYQYNKFSKLYAFTYSPLTFAYPSGTLMLPKKDVDAVKNDIKDCSQFYLLESINVEQLTTTRTELTVEEGYLQSLLAREVMTDDYDSHDKIIPKYSFAYNSRLNIANLKKQLFLGYSAASMFTFSDGLVWNWNDSPPTQMDFTYSVNVFIFINQDGRDIVVRGDSGSIGNRAPILFLYYPNVNAYKAVIQVTRYGVGDLYEVKLEKHNFLNGAFYFSGWDDLSKTTNTLPVPSLLSMRTIDIVNKIYTSEVNNPFSFPVLGINTVGTGTILGISAAAKALSEGQFGQFPLYAFTTEGVWALEVSATGSYSAKQPITRDVVINTDSITQIDSAVLFATDRGIMHISGSTVQCISDRLNTEDLFTIAELPKCDKLINIFNCKAGEDEQLTLENVTMLPFSEFLAGCRIIYDYTHQHIIVYNPAVRYAYVYSLKSQTWGMMHSYIEGNVNSYPEALAMANGSKLVDFSKSNAETTTSLIITRPFKMDDPNAFKTVNTIIQRGMFRSTHVQQVLYGSNDLIHWHTVWSSVDKLMRGFRGTPYKAYRLALVCKFDRGESIYGCTVVYEPRMTNQVR